MIHRHYNPWYITNEGERAADRHFTVPEGVESGPFHIIYQLRISSRFHRQMAGECDFVILTRFGLMAVEVKGGLISHGPDEAGHRGFYRQTGIGGKETTEPVKNPFTQADGNADAIRKFLVEMGREDVFVGGMACFPECEFHGEGIEVQDLWHLGAGRPLLEVALEAIRGQITAFSEKYGKKARHSSGWAELQEEDMLQIVDMLKPEFEPKLYRTRSLLNQEESARRLEEGMHILSGLDENRRIMVQGPPGSGKTTYALHLIRKLCHRQGKTGLYLCWNELLAAEMKEKLAAMQPSVTNEALHVAPLFRFAEELAMMTGGRIPAPTLDDVKDNALKPKISACLNWLHSHKKLPRYDFIIADEAQDFFAKGLDLVLKYLLKDNNPLQKGNYYIFYDDQQAYPGTSEMEAYVRTRDALKEFSAFYMLFSSLRVNSGHGLTELILDAGMGIADPGKAYGEDVRFITYKNPEEAIGIIRQRIDQERMLSGTKPSEIIVLLASDLFKEDAPLRSALAASPGFELMTPENSDQKSDLSRYTSILKSKGLEREVVILVFYTLSDAKSQFQLFVGASRGKGRVMILNEAALYKH